MWIRSAFTILCLHWVTCELYSYIDCWPTLPYYTCYTKYDYSQQSNPEVILSNATRQPLYRCRMRSTFSYEGHYMTYIYRMFSFDANQTSIHFVTSWLQFCRMSSGQTWWTETSWCLSDTNILFGFLYPSLQELWYFHYWNCVIKHFLKFSWFIILFSTCCYRHPCQ